MTVSPIKSKERSAAREAVDPRGDLRALWPRWLNDHTTAWLGSMLFHLVAMIVIGLSWSSARDEDAARAKHKEWLVEVDPSGSGGDSSAPELGTPWQLDGPVQPTAHGEAAPLTSDARLSGLAPTTSTVPIGDADAALRPLAGGVGSPTTSLDGTPSASAGQPSALASATLPAVDWIATSGSPSGGGLGGRQGDMKGLLLRSRGGTPASEAAVTGGLRWLAAHQRPDGSWRFDLAGPCEGRCRNAGDFASVTASTAIALLPFYGAGHTHRKGDYVETVQRGLYYLGTHMQATPDGADFQQGSMYSQGLATIVMCEAYAMSGDENLRQFCEESLRFIVHAQHEQGGWRYLPGQAGDMTSTGWQLMALKSGVLGKLPVEQSAFYRASQFLDGVQSDDRAGYGYQSTKEQECTTAIGLYCRMLTGWRRDQPDLLRGAALLEKWGPSANDMYYNYYATMVLNHLDLPTWSGWNQSIREKLIHDQAHEGHEAGSWFYDHRYSRQGGRLYVTALAILTLEVYYRYLPLYTPAAVDQY